MNTSFTNFLGSVAYPKQNIPVPRPQTSSGQCVNYKPLIPYIFLCSVELGRCSFSQGQTPLMGIKKGNHLTALICTESRL